MKIVQLTPSDKVVFVKALTSSKTYYIFRNDSEEVAITLNDNCTIKSSHKLHEFEMEFLREEYPELFIKSILQ